MENGLDVRIVGENAISDASCAAWAIANYLDVPYAEARELAIAEAGFRPYYGTPVFGKQSLNTLLEDLDMKLVKKSVRLTATKSDPREKLPEKAILLFGKHVVAYKHGLIYDVFNTLRVPGCKQIKGYWTEA